MYGDRCFQIGAQILPLPGFPEAYYSNTCVLVPGAQCFDLGQPASNFPAPGADFIARVRFYNNTIYTTAGPECAVGGGPFATVAQFQAGGYEVPGEPATTLVAALPDAATLERWMRDKLAGAPARVAAAAAAA